MPPRRDTPAYEAWKNSPKYELWLKRVHAHRFAEGYQAVHSRTEFKKGEPSLKKGTRVSEETKEKLRNLDRSTWANAWSDDECEILKANYLTCTVNELAALLPRPRSIQSIQSRLHSMGLVKGYRKLEPILEYPPDNGLFLPGDDEKKCYECNTIKPLHQFSSDKSQSDGYEIMCRPCYSRKKRAIYKRYSPRTGGELDLDEQKDDIPLGHQKCHVCREIKPVGSFDRQKKSKVGRDLTCKDCRKKPSAGNHEASLWTNYGLTIEDYNILLKEQNGVCAICQRIETALNPLGEQRRLAVDHCHVTGAIRGLLCSKCNQALGLLGENPDRVKALLRYIEERCLW